MTKRERKARQRGNRNERRFISWCRRVNQQAARDARLAETLQRIDRALSEIRGTAGGVRG